MNFINVAARNSWLRVCHAANSLKPVTLAFTIIETLKVPGVLAGKLYQILFLPSGDRSCEEVPWAKEGAGDDGRLLLSAIKMIPREYLAVAFFPRRLR